MIDSLSSSTIPFATTVDPSLTPANIEKQTPTRHQAVAALASNIKADTNIIVPPSLEIKESHGRLGDSTLAPQHTVAKQQNFIDKSLKRMEDFEKGLKGEKEVCILALVEDPNNKNEIAKLEELFPGQMQEVQKYIYLKGQANALEIRANDPSHTADDLMKTTNKFENDQKKDRKYEENERRTLAEPVNLTIQKLTQDGKTTLSAVRSGALTYEANERTNLKELREASKMTPKARADWIKGKREALESEAKAQNDTKALELIDFAEKQKALESINFAKKQLEAFEVNPEFVVSQRESYLRNQMSHLIQAHIEAHPEVVEKIQKGEITTLDIIYQSYMGEGEKPKDKHGWHWNEANDLRDMQALFSEEATIKFVKPEEVGVSSESGKTTYSIYVNDDLVTKTCELNAVLLNIPVRGTPVKDGIATEINNEACVKLSKRVDSNGKPIFPEIIEELQSFNDNPECTYEAASRLQEKCLNNQNVLFSSGCRQAKDRTGAMYVISTCNKLKDRMMNEKGPIEIGLQVREQGTQPPQMPQTEADIKAAQLENQGKLTKKEEELNQELSVTRGRLAIYPQGSDKDFIKFIDKRTLLIKEVNSEKDNLKRLKEAKNGSESELIERRNEIAKAEVVIKYKNRDILDLEEKIKKSPSCPEAFKGLIQENIDTRRSGVQLDAKFKEVRKKNQDFLLKESVKMLSVEGGAVRLVELNTKHEQIKLQQSVTDMKQIESTGKAIFSAFDDSVAQHHTKEFVAQVSTSQIRQWFTAKVLDPIRKLFPKCMRTLRGSEELKAELKSIHKKKITTLENPLKK